MSSESKQRASDPVEVQPATAALESLDRRVRSGEIGLVEPFPTGFHPLDRILDGGLRPGDLTLVGGVQAVGKTTFTLQIARNLAALANTAVAYVCFEHDEVFLLQRLLALEAFLSRDRSGGEIPTLGDLRQLLLCAAHAAQGAPGTGLADLLRDNEIAARAAERVQLFSDRLYLIKASAAESDVSFLRQVITQLKEQHGSRLAVYVDYLQKVPVSPSSLDEEERVTRVTSQLKDLALQERVPVVAVVIADRAGLEAQRLRLHHLRGSSPLSYESDVALILNNKYRVVAKKSITFNYHHAQDLKDWVVCTVEKNRSGRDQVDVQFRSYFSHGAFDPRGDFVSETLIDERLEQE